MNIFSILIAVILCFAAVGCNREEAREETRDLGDETEDLFRDAADKTRDLGEDAAEGLQEAADEVKNP